MKPLILKALNKSTVAIIEKPHTFGVTISISIKAGSYNEIGFPAGTAHFVEHMMFKGTTSRTAREINNTINSVGGSLNAVTGEEETKYYVTIPSTHWKQAFEILKDIVGNATFPESELELERNVILEEIKMYEDDPVSSLITSMNLERFKDYPERQSIIGTEESVRSITRDDLIRFVETYYQPENMSFVAVGNLRFEEFSAEAITYESSYNKRESLPQRSFTPYKMEAEIAVLEDTEQAHLNLIMNGLDVHSSDTTALEVFANILGGFESSRLFQEIRENRGLAYSVHAYTEYFSDFGSLVAYVGTNEEYFDEIQDIILDSIRDIAQNGVSDEELSRSIAYLKGESMLQLDSNMFMNDFLSHTLRYNLDSNPLKAIEDYDSITSADVKRVAEKFVREDSYLTGTLTPKYTIDDVE